MAFSSFLRGPDRIPCAQGGAAVNWLLPGFLAGTALLALPVVLHFLRSKPKSAFRFPTLRFLDESAIRDTRRHRLLRWITLLLRCLVMVLLAAAFARPFFLPPDSTLRHFAIVAIDNSMSMHAAGRWEKYKAEALAHLSRLAPGDQAALLLMHPAPRWLVAPTTDLARVRQELENARPGHARTRYGPALRMAGEILAADPARSKSLFWMADEQRLGWAGVDFANALPPGIQIRLGAAAQAPGRQAAIVELASQPEGGGLLVTVRQFAPANDQRTLSVYADNRKIAEKNFPLHDGDNTLELPLPELAPGAGLRVSMNPDDLPADDTAWVALRESAANTILMDGAAEGDFLHHAIESTRALELGGLVPAPLPGSAWPVGSPVIARREATFRPPTASLLDRFADAGGALWIFVEGSRAQVEWLKRRGVNVAPRKSTVGAWHLHNWDTDHPTLSVFSGGGLVSLMDVEFYEGFDLAGDALVPLASWPDGKIAIAEWGGGGRRWLLAGFPIGREATNWPTHPSFVPFIHNSAAWLGALAGNQRHWRVGDVIPLDGAGRWRVLDAASPVPERAVSGSVSATIPGLYEFIPDHGPVRRFAVNILPEESDLTPWPDPARFGLLEKPREFETRARHQHAPPPVSAATAENGQRLWWWLLAFCAAALLAELALANRTAP